MCFLLFASLFAVASGAPDLSSAGASKPALAFPVHRALHYGINGNPATFGSRKSHIRALAKMYDARKASGTSSTHEVLLVPLESLLPSDVPRVLKASTAGIVFILPAAGVAISAETEDAIFDLETRIVQEGFDVPLYFTEADDVAGVLELLRGSGTYTFVDKGDNSLPPMKTSVTAQTLVVDFSDGNGKGAASVGGKGRAAKDDRPAIVIVASHDTLGVAPTLAPRTLRDGGSGATATLELIRMYSRLFSLQNTRAAYRLLFVLSSSSKLNHFGVKQWLAEVDYGLLDKVEFVLCLDQLTQPELFFHMSRKQSEDESTMLFRTMQTVAERIPGIQLKLINKKINVSHHEMRWEHEIFVHKKLVAATLSSLQSPRPLFLRSSLVDRRKDANIVPVLSRNIQFVANLLSLFLFPALNTSKEELFSGPSGAQQAHITALQGFFTNYARPVPFQSGKISSTLLQTIQAFTSKVTAHESTYKGNYVFYEHTDTIIEMYETRSIQFELGLMIMILAYLGVLLVLYNGGSVRRALEALQDLFPSRSFLRAKKN